MDMIYYSIKSVFYKIAAIFSLILCMLFVFSFSSQAEEQTQEDAPTVIVIMNESFFDPSILGNLSVNEDYLPFYHSLKEYTGKESDNIVKGTLHVSDIGGNSTNTEFEFLTGNSMAFLSPTLSPYSNYLNPESEYLPKLFNKSGYHTVAVYPYKGSSWNRNLAYSLMDFSEIYFQDDFDSPKMIRNYISDLTVYQKILQICDESSQPVFAFCSTIQNHSGYQKSYSNFPSSIQAIESSNDSLNQYLSLLKESDKALEYLIHRIAKSDKETMVVFFGNHQPNDYVVNTICETSTPLPSSYMSPDIRYTVPYFIWANFDLSGYEMADTSPSLLGNTILNAVGVELDDFQKVLTELKSIIPAISSQGYMDKNGSFHAFSTSLDSTVSQEEILAIHRYHNLINSTLDSTN